MAPNLGVRHRTVRAAGPVDNAAAATGPIDLRSPGHVRSRSPAADAARRARATCSRRCSGRGGSGEVWRAVPRRGGPAVAVKVLVDGDPERQAREAALLGELDHPHLVRLIEVVHQPRRGGAAAGRPGPRAAGGRQPGRAARPPRTVAAGGGGHGDRAGRRRAGPRPRERRRPRRPVPGQHRLHGRGPAGPHRPGCGPGPRRDGGRRGHPALRRPHGRPRRRARARPPTSSASRPPPSTRSPASRRGTRPPRPTRSRSPRRATCPTCAELAPDAPAELIEVIGRGLSADPHDRGSAAAFALDLRHACRPEPVRLPVAGRARRRARPHRTRPADRADPSGARTAPAPGARRGRADGPGRGPPSGSAGVPAARADRRTAVLALVVAGLVVAGLAGACRARRPRRDRRWRRRRPRSRPRRPRSTPPTPTDPAEEPTSPEPTDWAAVVAELYERRAAAFATGSAAALDDVYTPGSALLAADRSTSRGPGRRRARCCAASRPSVVRGDGGVRGRRPRASSTWSTAGRPTRWCLPAPGRGGAEHRARPARVGACAWCSCVTGDGWRIESAARTG